MTLSAPQLTLNDLIRRSGIAESDVLVFRHRPFEPKLNSVFDWIAAERQDLFDCYQSCHAPRTEAALAKARYLASFIRYGPGQAIFVGMYEVAGRRWMSAEECLSRPLHQELMSFGMSGFKATESRSQLLEFDLHLTDWHAEWRGRLLIRWPGLERSWYRWADRNEFAIEAVTQESPLSQAMPRWNRLVLDWAQLALLPSTWRGALSQWRGVYLIVDQSDGQQYVGSACGAENLLQRWRDYARTGHGGNKLLRARDPSSFRFSILQLVAPDLPRLEVEEIESSWKDRLRSRTPYGLNEN